MKFRLLGYDKTLDMWSIGVIIYMSLCGFFPFRDDDNTETIESCLDEESIFLSEEWENVSDDAVHLIQSLLIIEVSFN